MAANLEGKSILVTGVSGAGQIGYAVAEELAARGARLAIVARKQVKVEERAAKLRSTGAQVLAITGDLTRETDVHNAVDIVVRDYGRIDVLINLAGGLTRYKPAIEHSLEDWTEELGNNLLSSFLCSREALVRMRENGGGVIINFARAGLPQANMVAYNCAKAGVEALTRTLALEGRDAGIRVNAVAPGLVDTESNVSVMKPKDLKRWASRKDVAQCVAFLAGDESAGVTGQVLAVTGWGL